MKKIFLSLGMISLLLPILSFAPTASAALITGPFNFFGAGTGTGTATTTTPGGSTGNTVVITENFTSSGMMSTSFLMPLSGSSTQYLFTKTVTNNTQDIWEDWKVAMACGQVGEGDPSPSDCAFFPLTVNYGVTSTNSEGGALLDVTDPTLFHWSSMNVAPGESFVLTFAVDTCGNCSGSWAIFETPSILAVPEPGTLALISACLMLLTMGGRSVRRT